MTDNENKNEKTFEALADGALDEVVGGTIRLPTFVVDMSHAFEPRQITECERCHGTFPVGVVTEHAVSSGYLWLCPDCVQAYKDAGLYFHKADI